VTSTTTRASAGTVADHIRAPVVLVLLKQTGLSSATSGVHARLALSWMLTMLLGESQCAIATSKFPAVTSISAITTCALSNGGATTCTSAAVPPLAGASIVVVVVSTSNPMRPQPANTTATATIATVRA
jgi:hypothetical protein